MAEILYHRQGLFGPKLELHIAPEGLMLVGQNGVNSTDYAPISDIANVHVTKDKRKADLKISFGELRPAWVFNKMQIPVAEWAKAVIDEEISAITKQTKPEYSKKVALDSFSTICHKILSTGDVHAVVDLVDFILIQAVMHEASDVHFDPFSESTVVRFRIDGVLQDVAQIDADKKRLLTSRLKVVSRLATFKNAVAQEGRAAMKVGNRTVDFRFSSLPTIHGEKVTVRIFDPEKSIFRLDKLGMNREILSTFQNMLMQPQGTILLTGPSSSGKTTTMYAALSYLREHKKNLSTIATVEDPVEYDLQIVNQTQVNNYQGLTFANVLRTILRQDPEVIMVGEIRDRETADIAIQAGLTGHMILSTVHARSALGVLIRLVDLGVEPFLAASSVSAVLSQRLVRVVCKECAKTVSPTADERAKYSLSENDVLKVGAGCMHCGGTGYSGRTAIFQLVPISEKVRDMLLKNPSLHELEMQIKQEQLPTLLDDGIAKVKSGITTLDELTRVLG